MALVLLGAEAPLRVLCCRETQHSIRESVKRLLDDKIKAAGLDSFYQSTDTEIRGINKTLFFFHGLRTNPESIKSLESIDIAWVEEAHTAAQRSLDLLLPTIRGSSSRGTDRAEIWFSWNPRYPDDPVDAMFRGNHRNRSDTWAPPPDSITLDVTWRDNPWFPDVLAKDMAWDFQHDPLKAAHIWNGGYIRHAEAQVFKNWRVGDPEEFKSTAETRFYYGADWGFATDPTALVRCWIEGRKLFVDWEAYQVGCEIDKTPELFDTVPGARLWPIIADSARPETISYLQKHGFPRMVAAKKGAGSVEDGVEFLRSYDIIVHPRCIHLIDELTFYSYKTDKLTGEVLPIIEDKKNHVLDGLRYGIESLRRVKKWEFV